jgi:ribosomal subunit interface protein
MIKNIHSTSFEVSEAIKSHVNAQLDKILDHHDRITKADVNLKKDGFHYIAEINLHVPTKGEIVITQASEDMYHSITEATNKILIKLKKITEKSKSKIHKKIQLDS